MALVTVKKYAADSGYSEKAIDRKREEGVWLEGVEYVKAPDGRILIDTCRVEEWMRHKRRMEK